MNTWSYLILIAALFAVAALMLYARFSSRSRRKLLHHSFRDISANQLDRSDVDPEEGLASDTSETFSEDKDTTKREIRQPNSALTAEPILGHHTEEEEYLDELQEAAAGLAMLMRSSPVLDRTSPVVFAPEDEGLVEEESGETILIPKIETVAETNVESEGTTEVEAEALLDGNEVEANVRSEPLVAEAIFPEAESGVQDESELEDATTAAEEDEEVLAVSAERSSLTLPEIVGEEVAGQFSEIDESLNALEMLVSGIETCLSAWGSDSDSEQSDSAVDPVREAEGDVVVEEAA